MYKNTKQTHIYIKFTLCVLPPIQTTYPLVTPSNFPSPIRSYSLGSVINTKPDSTLKTQYHTQNDFYVAFENNFLVLLDGKTVFAPDALDRRKLIMEDIISRNFKYTGTSSGWIYTVLFDHLTQTLLVGDLKGHVVQYQKTTRFNLFGLLRDSVSFSLVKDYGEIGVGWVCSSGLVGRLAVFGGSHNSLIAIDIQKQEICKGIVKSPFEQTLSFEVCHTLNSRVYLSVAGSVPSFSSGESDCLDVGLIYNNDDDKDDDNDYKQEETIQVRKESIKTRALLHQKDEQIHSLRLRIKKLESLLQSKNKANQGINVKRVQT